MSFRSLLDISDPYSMILLDAYGVFWAGSKAGLYPGALDTLSALKAQGKVVGIISNASSLTLSERQKYKSKGLLFRIHYDFSITSGQLLRDRLLTGTFPVPSRGTGWAYSVIFPVHPLHGSPHRAIFEGTPCREITDPHESDFVYIGSPYLNGADQVDSAVFRATIDEIAQWQRPLVCANPDEFVVEGVPARRVVKQGKIATLCELRHIPVYLFGKPSPEVIETAITELSQGKTPIKRDQILMVGDTPRTDIVAGNRAGIHTALITDTGVFAEEIAHEGEMFFQGLSPSEQPTYRINALSREPGRSPHGL